jgi:hypothetical protein
MKGKGETSKISLIWTSNQFQFLFGNLSTRYSSSLLLDNSNDQSNTDSASFDDTVFVKEENVDNVLKSNFEQYLGSSLRFLEAIDRRDLEFSGTFSRSYVYFRAIQTAYLELLQQMNENNREITEVRVPVQLIIPTPLSFPSKLLIKDYVQSTILKVSTTSSSSSKIVASFLQKADWKKLLSDDLHPVKLLVLELGEGKF